jgi:hypothetical protein
MIEEAKASGVTTEKAMWQGIEDVEQLLEIVKKDHPDHYWAFLRRTHERMYGCHYNKAFADWRIAQMYWKDKQGNTHHAPHWTSEQHKGAYEAMKAKIPATYNCYDFAVTLEMIYSDNICLYRSWWPEATDADLEAKVVDAAVNYLKDDDDPDCKIWHRFEK